METPPSLGGASGRFQPDLFDERGWNGVIRDSGNSPRSVMPEPATLPDDALIAALSEAGPSEARAVCREIAARSLDRAVPALEALWRRFAGFGIERPLVEQLAVLGALARLDGLAARSALRRIVLRGVPDSALPAALGAAARAGLVLPAGFIAPLLAHEDVVVRSSAFVLADRARVSRERLCEGLGDASPGIRRATAVALAHRGDTGARETLVRELARSPSEEIVHALAAIPDEDAIVHLGRCAARHPALAGTVVQTLRRMESPRARRLALRLEGEGSGGI